MSPRRRRRTLTWCASGDVARRRRRRVAAAQAGSANLDPAVDDPHAGSSGAGGRGSAGGPRPSGRAGRPSARGRPATRSGGSGRRRRGRRSSASGRRRRCTGRSGPRGAGTRRRSPRGSPIDSGADMCGQRSSTATIPAGVWASRTSRSPWVTRRIAPSRQLGDVEQRLDHGAVGGPGRGELRGNGGGGDRARRSRVDRSAGTDPAPARGPSRGRDANEEAVVSRRRCRRGRRGTRRAGSGRRRDGRPGRRRVAAASRVSLRHRPPSSSGGGPAPASQHRREGGDERRTDADPEGLGDPEAERLVDAADDLAMNGSTAPGRPPGGPPGSSARGRRCRSAG